MGSTLVVVVLVLTSDAQRPATEAMTTAARRLLGPEAAVLLHEVDAVPADDAAARLGDSLHADAVVEVSWTEPDRRHAHVHVLAVPAGRWTDRELDFAEADPEPDKGRTVGIAFASLVPVRAPATAPPTAAATAPPAHVEPALKPVERPWPYTATGAIVASSGIGGNAGGIGVDTGLELRVAGPLAVRAGAVFRGGEVDAASASSSTFALAGGAVLEVLRTASERPIAVSLRIDALLVNQSFTRTAFGEIPTSHGRWLPGGDALVGATWYPLPRVGVGIATGFETVFGTTRVFVDQDRVATIPRARWVFEAGIHVRF
ncbi:MAG: hypothetical protein NVS3B10_27290 [Polyangiales bacterium]